MILQLRNFILIVFWAQVHERELFLAKRTEKISATQIRGKCTVCILHKVKIRLRIVEEYLIYIIGVAVLEVHL